MFISDPITTVNPFGSGFPEGNSNTHSAKKVDLLGGKIDLGEIIEKAFEDARAELTKAAVSAKKDEQVIIVRYKKHGPNDNDLSWVEVERPNGNFRHDEIALCAAIGKVLNEDIEDIDALKTTKHLSAAMVDYITDLMFKALRTKLKEEN